MSKTYETLVGKIQKASDLAGKNMGEEVMEGEWDNEVEYYRILNETASLYINNVNRLSKDQNQIITNLLSTVQIQKNCQVEYRKCFIYKNLYSR